MNAILFLLTFCLTAAWCHAEPPAIDATEPTWSGWLAVEIGGEAEASFRDDQGAGRVDVLTDRFAIEVEWAKAPKGPESLEQASRYGRAFGRQPVVIYLVGRGNRTAEKAIAATTLQFGKRYTPRVQVLWFDMTSPATKSLDKLRRQLDEITDATEK